MIAYIASFSLLIVFILIVRALFRKTVSPRAIYSLWLLVVIRMLLPFSLFTVNVPLPAFLRDAAPVLPVEEPAPGRNGELLSPFVVQPSGESGQTGGGSFGLPTPPSGGEAVSPSRGGFSAPDIKTVLFTVWVSGSCLVAGWMLYASVSFELRLRRDRVLRGTAGKTKIYVSENAGVPCIAGPIPSVYITPEAAGSGSEKMIVLHEFSHLRHLDPLWSVFRALALTVFWWDPLVWAAAVVSKRDAEFAADDAVAFRLAGEERTHYAKVLIDTIPRKNRFVVGFGTSPMKERIRLLTKEKNNKRICLILAFLLALTAAGCSFAAVNGTDEKTAAGNGGGKTGDPSTSPGPSPVDEAYEDLKLTLPVYRCDDVYRDASTPTFGEAEVTVPGLSGPGAAYTLTGAQVLLCEDGCDQTDVVSRAFWGYAPAWPITRYEEYGPEDGWNYPTRRYIDEIPASMRGEMEKQGGEIPKPRKYLYLLKLDATRYLFLCVSPLQDSLPVPEGGDGAVVNAFVKETTVVFLNEESPSALLTYRPPIALSGDERLAFAAVYGKNCGSFVPFGDALIRPGKDGECYYVMGVSKDRRPSGVFESFHTYRAVSKDGALVSVDEVETFTVETVLKNGKPYSGSPEGIFHCVAVRRSDVYGSGQLDGYTVYIRSDGTFDAVTGLLSTDAVVLYEGTWRIDPATGETVFRTKDRGSAYVDVPGAEVRGKLLEYGGFVHFVCEESGLSSPASGDPLPLTFLPNTDGYADPPKVALDGSFSGDWVAEGERPITLTLDATAGTIVWEDASGRYTGDFSVNPLTRVVTSALRHSLSSSVYGMRFTAGYSQSLSGTELYIAVISSNAPSLGEWTGRQIVFRPATSAPADLSETGGEESLDAAISSVLRIKYYNHGDPDGLIHAQSYAKAGGVHAESGKEGAVTVYLIVYHATYNMMNGSPSEVEGAFVPTVMTFVKDGNGAYSLDEYWAEGEEASGGDRAARFPDAGAYIAKYEKTLRKEALENAKSLVSGLIGNG